MGGGTDGDGGFGGDEERRRKRLDEIGAMSHQEIENLIDRMGREQDLPRPGLHYFRHRREFGEIPLREYEDLFRRHIARDNLRRFTFIQRVGSRRMWYLVAEDTGYVAQYNEDAGRYYTFFKPSDLDRFLEEGRRRWVELRRTDEGWRPVDQ